MNIHVEMNIYYSPALKTVILCTYLIISGRRTKGNRAVAELYRRNLQE